MNYEQKLRQSITDNNSILCVGLDPLIDRIPKFFRKKNSTIDEVIIHFLEGVIDSTSNHCCAYKPNLAFFEALGAHGLEIFQHIVDYIPENKIIIADAKRGDIGHTAESYKKAYFENFKVDAITLSPLMGFETLEPFLQDESKAIYVLTLTSNLGAKDFLLKPFQGFDKMSEYIAEHLKSLNNQSTGHVGMVVGATKASQLAEVIKSHPTASLLIPGIGAQGGSVEILANALEEHHGIPLINSSRGIIYAGNDENWQVDVREAAKDLQSKLTTITKRYV